MAFRKIQREGPINASLDLASDVADTVVDVVTIPVDLVRAVRTWGRSSKDTLVSSAKRRQMPPEPLGMLMNGIDQVVAVPRQRINEISGRVRSHTQ